MRLEGFLCDPIGIPIRECGDGGVGLQPLGCLYFPFVWILLLVLIADFGLFRLNRGLDTKL